MPRVGILAVALVIVVMMSESGWGQQSQPSCEEQLAQVQFTRDLLVDMFKGYKMQVAGEEHVDACTTFKALTAAQQTTIITTLGGTRPCP